MDADEAVQISMLACTHYEATRKNTSLLQDENSQKTSTKPEKEENLKMNNGHFHQQQQPNHQQVDASSSHPKEFENEQWTIVASASPLTERSDHCMSIGGSDGSESLPLENQQKVAAAEQIYVLLPMGVAEDIEAEKGERSVFLCVSNSAQGRYGCDWYSLDLVNKECSKISGRLEWGGIRTTHFGVAAVGSIIYILGGLYPGSFFGRLRSDKSCSNDVFYLDVHYPRDGWKAGPQLPSPHFEPVATSMNDTIYIFNGKYVFARALDSSYFESGWKSLESPNLESLSDLHFLIALPDPIRDRIFLFTVQGDVFAYYPRKGELEWIDPNLEIFADWSIMRASAVVDGVLYHNEPDTYVLLCAYDLGKRKMLTPHYLYKFDIHRFGYYLFNWDQLLDLGGGKLCLVKYRSGRRDKVLSVFLKLKVDKESGEDEVHITVVSLDVFRIAKDSIIEHSVAL